MNSSLTWITQHSLLHRLICEWNAKTLIHFLKGGDIIKSAVVTGNNFLRQNFKKELLYVKMRVIFSLSACFFGMEITVVLNLDSHLFWCYVFIMVVILKHYQKRTKFFEKERLDRTDCLCQFSPKRLRKHVVNAHILYLFT